MKTTFYWQCYKTHNSQEHPDYPLCAVQLKDFMYAAKDTPTCVRKSNIPNPIGGKWLWMVFLLVRISWYYSIPAVWLVLTHDLLEDRRWDDITTTNLSLLCFTLYTSNISMHILHTVLCIFSKIMSRRTCLTIKGFSGGWSFPLFSWLICLNQQWYCRKKLEGNHS